MIPNKGRPNGANFSTFKILYPCQIFPCKISIAAPHFSYSAISYGTLETFPHPFLAQTIDANQFYLSSPKLLKQDACQT